MAPMVVAYIWPLSRLSNKVAVCLLQAKKKKKKNVTWSKNGGVVFLFCGEKMIKM